jgi:hypothetical protein
MVVSAKSFFGSAAASGTEHHLLKDVASGVYVQARLAYLMGSYCLSLSAATNTTLNTLASLALATLSTVQAYKLAMQVQGQAAFVNLTRDDGGPVFIPGSAAFASVGVTGNAAVTGRGVPGLAISEYGGNSLYLRSWMETWEVDSLPVSPSAGFAAYDSYTLSGNNVDSYRVSSAGVFAGQKLINNQKGAFPKMVPSTTSLAVVCAPVDQGVANDLISAVVSVKERFSYANRPGRGRQSKT